MELGDVISATRSSSESSCDYEGPSAAAPQPNRQEDVHHEGHENHEVRSLKYPKPFVSFVNFVVRPYFLIEHSNIGTVARKFAQAA